MKLKFFIAVLLVVFCGLAESSPTAKPVVQPDDSGRGFNVFNEKGPGFTSDYGPTFLTDDVIRSAVLGTPAEPVATNSTPNRFAGKSSLTKEEEVLTRAFQEAKVPDCLHEEAMKFTPPKIGPVAVGGQLAIPWWAYSALSGHCN